MVNFIVAHDLAWKTAFDHEVRLISTTLGDGFISLHHIGSTSIPNILAKPIIDLLGAVDNFEELDRSSGSMEAIGYKVMGTFGIEGRRYFRKNNSTGQRTHHLHIYEDSSPHIERHLAFRDYLREHPDVAAEYSALKSSLMKEKALSWESYLDGKSPFIVAKEKDAVNWYRRNNHK